MKTLIIVPIYIAILFLAGYIANKNDLEIDFFEGHENHGCYSEDEDF